MVKGPESGTEKLPPSKDGSTADPEKLLRESSDQQQPESRTGNRSETQEDENRRQSEKAIREAVTRVTESMQMLATALGTTPEKLHEAIVKSGKIPTDTDGLFGSNKGPGPADRSGNKAIKDWKDWAPQAEQANGILEQTPDTQRLANGIVGQAPDTQLIANGKVGRAPDTQPLANGEVGRAPEGQAPGNRPVKPEARTPGDIAPGRVEKAPEMTLAKAFLRGIEKPNGGEVIPGRDNPEATVKAYEAYLKQNGFRDTRKSQDLTDRVEKFKGFLEQTKHNLDNPAINKHLKGTPEQEMARICKAMNEVMEGKNGPLKGKDRCNMVMGMASRIADPEHYGNQGKHMSCVLESLGNAKLPTQGADHLEALASLANTGKAYVGEGKYRHQVTINQASRVPDDESAQTWNSEAFKKGGQRDLPGQYTDALFGQFSADLKTERLQSIGKLGANQRLEYYAAHLDSANAGYQGGQNATYEGLVKTTTDRNGRASRSLVGEGSGEGPDMMAWDAAELHTHVTGHQGGVFINEKLARLSGRKPAGMGDDVTMTTFNGSNLQEKLEAYQQRTGQAAQICVNAPYLKGGGEAGHGLHAMTASIVDGKVKMDNQWTEDADNLAHEMTVDEIDKATNPDRWHGVQPDWSRERFDPDSNKDTRNHLEDEAEKRRKQKDDEDKAKAAKEEQQKEDMVTYQDAMNRWQRLHDLHVNRQDAEKLAANARGEKYEETPFTEAPPTKPA